MSLVVENECKLLTIRGSMASKAKKEPEHPSSVK